MSPLWAASETVLRHGALLLTWALLLAAGCQGKPAARVLQVYAATSLTEAFGELVRTFEAANPGHRVALTLAGSQVLRLQIEQGAAAQVLASANPRHMQALVAAGLVRHSRVLAHNELALIVPLDNPAGIKSLADLPRAKRLVIGTENVPVGSYARQMLGRAARGLGAEFQRAALASVVSQENNVRLVRAKVELGEADAALVYRTDAAASRRVRSVPIPSRYNVRVDYPMGLVVGRGDADLAQRWVAHVLSPQGQAQLARRGFVAAP